MQQRLLPILFLKKGKFVSLFMAKSNFKSRNLAYVQGMS